MKLMSHAKIYSAIQQDGEKFEVQENNEVSKLDHDQSVLCCEILSKIQYHMQH